MWPLHDDLVGLREAGGRGEDGPCVAHGDAVAEEGPGPDQRRGEVDRPEDQHPRRRHPGLDQHGGHRPAAGLPRGLRIARPRPGGAVGPGGVPAPRSAGPGRAVGGDVDQAGTARVQQGAGLRGHRAVQGGVTAQRPVDGAVGGHVQGPAEQLVGPGHHPGQGPGPPGRSRGDGGGHRAPPGRVAPHGNHQHLQYAAAGQSDGEGVLVAVAETVADRAALGQCLLTEGVDRPLHATAGHTPDGLALGVDGQRGPGLPGGTAVDGDHGGDGEVAPLLAPFVQVGCDVQHGGDQLLFGSVTGHRAGARSGAGRSRRGSGRSGPASTPRVPPSCPCHPGGGVRADAGRRPR